MGFVGLTTDHCAHWSQSHILQIQVPVGANTMSYLEIWRTVKGIAWVFVEVVFSLTPIGSLNWGRSHRPGGQSLARDEESQLSVSHSKYFLIQSWGSKKASRLNLHFLPLWDSTKDSPEHQCEFPPTSKLKEVTDAHKIYWLCFPNLGRDA